MKSLGRFSDVSHGLKKLVKGRLWHPAKPCPCRVQAPSRQHVLLLTYDLHQDHWEPVKMDSQGLPRFPRQRSGREPKVTL